jgi:hypothetical protein
MASTLRYRGLRLDGPVEELHRALDRLRRDTAPAPLDHQQLDHQQSPSPPTPTRRRRHDPSDGQAALLEEAS